MWFWALKFFSSLAKIDEQRSQNCIQFVQKTELREKVLSRKFHKSIFFEFWVSFWWFFPKSGNFRRGCQNCNNHVQTDILTVYFWIFFPILFCFLTLSWKFLDFGKKVWPMLSLLQVAFPREKTWLEIIGSSLELLMWSVLSWTSSKESQWCWQICTPPSTCPVEDFVQIFSRKYIKVRKYLLTLRGISSPFSTFFRHCCQNRAPHDCR